MGGNSESRKDSLHGLAFSQFLALLFLGGCVWWVFHEIEIVLGASKITASIVWDEARNSVLPLRLAGFAAPSCSLTARSGSSAGALHA